MQVFEIPMHHVRLSTSLLLERREISREQILLPMESVIEKGGAFLSIPILSIYVATYNHEQYIVQALDSILMQETKYSYEVLVGEDCSTDNTRAVLKAYEQQHPAADDQKPIQLVGPVAALHEFAQSFLHISPTPRFDGTSMAHHYEPTVKTDGFSCKVLLTEGAAGYTLGIHREERSKFL